MKTIAIKASSYTSEIRTIGIIVVIVFVMQMINPNFNSFNSIHTIFYNISMTGIIATGMTLVLIIRHIDLSVGANMGFCCVFTVLLQPHSIILAIIVPIIVGFIAGWINGYLVTKFDLPSLGVTITMSIILQGAILVMTNNNSITAPVPEFANIANYRIFGVSTLVYVFILCAIVLQIILKKTMFGRNILSCGGSLDASRYAGINVNRTQIGAFAVLGLMCGIAGVMGAAVFNAAGPAIGTNIAFYIITAVLLGGTSLAGGEGSVVMTFLGMALISYLDSALNFIGASDGYRNGFIGLLLVVLVAIDSMKIMREKYRS